jgi:SAM-dependent methyltransferase
MMKLIPRNLSDKNVLDAGCAAGWYSEQFTSRGANVTGMDLSPEMVKAAQRRLGDKAEIICHDLQKELPFKDHTFDFIVSSLTLHYIKDWSYTFSELSRVLKPTGELLFSVHHPFMDFTRFKCEDYFRNEPLTENWSKQGVSIYVSFYRRPLQDITHKTTQFFYLQEIVEPKPQEIMRDKNQKAFDYLMTNPHFLIVKAKSKKN